MTFIKGHKGWWLGKKHSLATKNKMREIRLRIAPKQNQHPNWKGGRKNYWCKVGRKVLISYHINEQCAHCGTLEKIHVHHKDKNYKNNKIDNLMFLCVVCHAKLHNQDIKKYIFFCEECGIKIYSRRKTFIKFCSRCYKKFYARNYRKIHSIVV